jgi:hypothetical protein
MWRSFCYDNYSKRTRPRQRRENKIYTSENISPTEVCRARPLNLIYLLCFEPERDPKYQSALELSHSRTDFRYCSDVSILFEL